MCTSIEFCGMFRDAVAQAGLQHRLPMRFHDLRHSFASMLIAKGVPLKVVSRAMGHSSVAITEKVYAHLDPERSLDAIRDALKL
jgi:integrase